MTGKGLPIVIFLLPYVDPSNRPMTKTYLRLPVHGKIVNALLNKSLVLLKLPNHLSCSLFCSNSFMVHLVFRECLLWKYWITCIWIGNAIMIWLFLFWIPYSIPLSSWTSWYLWLYASLKTFPYTVGIFYISRTCSLKAPLFHCIVNRCKAC